MLALSSQTLQNLTAIFPKEMNLDGLTSLVVSAFVVYWIAAIVAVFLLTFRAWGRWVPFLSALLWFSPWILRKAGQPSFADSLDQPVRWIFAILVIVVLCLMWKGRHWLERVLLATSAIMAIYFVCKLLGVL